MKPKGVEIEVLSGEDTAELVSVDDLRLFIDELGEAEYVGDHHPAARTREEIQAVIADLDGDQRKTVEEYQGGIAKKISTLLEKGDVLVARIDGETVGMIRVEVRESAPGNGYIEGTFYEIGSAVTDPGHRGLGVYRTLREAVVAHVNEKYGAVPMLSGTKRDGVKQLNKDAGWTEIHTGGYCAIHGIDVPAYMIATADLNGNTAFLWRPDVEGARGES